MVLQSNLQKTVTICQLNHSYRNEIDSKVIICFTKLLLTADLDGLRRKNSTGLMLWNKLNDTIDEPTCSVWTINEKRVIYENGKY